MKGVILAKPVADVTEVDVELSTREIEAVGRQECARLYGEGNDAESSMTTVTKMPYLEIQLTRGKVAIVDAEDFDRISAYSWQFDGRYARAAVGTIDGKQRFERMHRMVLGAPRSHDVDHINHDMLDNRKCNLRICTKSQNLGNRKKNSGGAQPFKGVEPWGNKWRARAAGKYLGLFKTAEDAAKAYDTAAKKIYGEYALTNFPTSATPAKAP